MPVCRIMKENNYTRVSNHYLRDNSLSFKAKGLLTLMLSLPEDWDYTITGLAQFTADGRVSIASTIRELELMGHIDACYEKLAEGMTEDQRMGLENFKDYLMEVGVISEREMFAYGLRLGMRLVVEVLTVRSIT